MTTNSVDIPVYDIFGFPISVGDFLLFDHGFDVIIFKRAVEEKYGYKYLYYSKPVSIYWKTPGNISIKNAKRYLNEMNVIKLSDAQFWAMDMSGISVPKEYFYLVREVILKKNNV